MVYQFRNSPLIGQKRKPKEQPISEVLIKEEQQEQNQTVIEKSIIDPRAKKIPRNKITKRNPTQKGFSAGEAVAKDSNAKVKTPQNTN